MRQLIVLLSLVLLCEGLGLQINGPSDTTSRILDQAKKQYLHSVKKMIPPQLQSVPGKMMKTLKDITPPPTPPPTPPGPAETTSASSSETTSETSAPPETT
nr:NS3 [Red mite densovirus 1]